jgi:hypothetical protein
MRRVLNAADEVDGAVLVQNREQRVKYVANAVVLAGSGAVHSHEHNTECLIRKVNLGWTKRGARDTRNELNVSRTLVDNSHRVCDVIHADTMLHLMQSTQCS